MAQPRVPFDFDSGKPLDRAESGYFERDPRLIDDAQLGLRPARDPLAAAQRSLQISLAFLVLIAGIDKFANFTTVWAKYLAPVFHQALGIEARTFMYGVGVLEMILGVGILLRPRVFAALTGAWISAIILNLLLRGGHLDVALHDVLLAAAAFALAKLSILRDVNLLRPRRERGLSL